MEAKLSRLALAVCAVLGTVVAPPVNAGAIVSPVAVSATNSYPDITFGTPENLINQGGLLSGFVSGVTDFSTYIASNPQHGSLSAGAEWFTANNASSATLTFNLGSVLSIASVAAWVDEFWGAGDIEVLLSVDDIAYSSVGSFAPTDWDTSVQSYGADVFSFAPTSAQYVQLSLSGCPQPLSISGGGCGMGEVAFNSVAATVPEPGTLVLMGWGIAGLLSTRRRQAN